MNRLTSSQSLDLKGIVPSSAGDLRYYPCMVTLVSGELLHRVYLVDQDAFVSVWGVRPGEDPAKSFIDPGVVRHIVESPYRLPVHLANRLYEVGESGMGFQRFTVILTEGRAFGCRTGNAVDFPYLPAGSRSDDIADVLPYLADGVETFQSPEYHWCLYTGDSAPA